LWGSGDGWNPLPSEIGDEFTDRHVCEARGTSEGEMPIFEKRRRERLAHAGFGKKFVLVEMNDDRLRLVTFHYNDRSLPCAP